MTKKGKDKQKKLQRKASHIKSEESNVEQTKITNEAIAAMHGGWKTPDHKSAHIGKAIKD